MDAGRKICSFGTKRRNGEGEKRRRGEGKCPGMGAWE
jgi:hypothetical protein